MSAKKIYCFGHIHFLLANVRNMREESFMAAVSSLGNLYQCVERSIDQIAQGVVNLEDSD